MRVCVFVCVCVCVHVYVCVRVYVCVCGIFTLLQETEASIAEMRNPWLRSKRSKLNTQHLTFHPLFCCTLLVFPYVCVFSRNITGLTFVNLYIPEHARFSYFIEALHDGAPVQRLTLYCLQY